MRISAKNGNKEAYFQFGWANVEAAGLSYYLNGSLLWAGFHFLCGGFYLVYAALIWFLHGGH